MKRHDHRRHLLATTMLAIGLLGGCASVPAQGDPVAEAAKDTFAAGIGYLRSGDYARARDALGDATARRPNDALRQTLLALSWTAESQNDPEALELALVGYRTALSFQENAFWPALLAGQVSLQRGRHDDALDYFARAALADPGSAGAFEGLALAAYEFGDVALAREAASRSAFLDPGSLVSWRILALSNAALSDGEAAGLALSQYASRGGEGVGHLEARTATLIRTASVDEFASNSNGDDGFGFDAPENQVSVDVTILLGQNTRRDRIGLNLLDGLRLQYAAQGQRSVTNTPGANTFDAQTMLSQAISIPELTWNLNMFNRFGQHYQVAARPSLTAYLGEASDFFIGRTLQVGVRGIDSGQLEQVDIGIRLTVTPVEINEDNVVVRVETGRSFVTTDQAGTFAEALSTFRQTVSATADVSFGQTLVLSGLSETVRDATSSRVPGLGDVPVIGSAFNQRSTTERQDAVLILLTPSRPVTFDSKPWMRPDGVERLVQLWDKVVDPTTNGAHAAERLSHARIFRRMQPGDIPAGGEWMSSGTADAVQSLLNLN